MLIICKNCGKINKIDRKYLGEDEKDLTVSFGGKKREIIHWFEDSTSPFQCKYCGAKL